MIRDPSEHFHALYELYMIPFHPIVHDTTHSRMTWLVCVSFICEISLSLSLLSERLLFVCPVNVCVVSVQCLFHYGRQNVYWWCTDTSDLTQHSRRVLDYFIMRNQSIIPSLGVDLRWNMLADQGACFLSSCLGLFSFVRLPVFTYAHAYIQSSFVDMRAKFTLPNRKFEIKRICLYILQHEEV